MQDDGVEIKYRYKYREMREANLKIITQGTLRFSSPLDFNDPFDSSPAYTEQSIMDVFVMRPEMMRTAGDALGMSPAKRLQNKGKFKAMLMNAANSGELAKSLLKDVGIFCVSRDPCNPLMWAHYAEDHTGFLIEFRITSEAPRAQLDVIDPHPVVYSEVRPIVRKDVLSRPAEEYCLTKSVHWAYEEEERVIDMVSGPGFYEYSREHFLCSVTAGARMGNDEFEHLRSAVKEAETLTGKAIPLYRAALSRTTYKVFIPDHPNSAVSSPS